MLGMLLLMAAAPEAAGWDDDEQDERSGFEVPSEWARAAHGFPEDKIVMDFDEAKGAEHDIHTSGATIEMRVDGEGAGFMQFAFNLLTGRFFSTPGANPHEVVSSPDIHVDGGKQAPSEIGVEPAAMEIIDEDEDEAEQPIEDEYHQVTGQDSF